MKKEIILASASERRSRILSECGIKHRIITSDIEETMDPDKHISEVVQINAVRKAEKVFEIVDSADSDAGQVVIIGADTLVVHGGDILGKPADEDEARNMLKRFSGEELEVYTGICVICSDTKKKSAGFSKSSLVVAQMADKQVERYFRLLAPYDKAGGFSIEGVGSLLFDDIEGSYFNILGLPMMKLSELFEQVDEDILDYIVMELQ